MRRRAQAPRVHWQDEAASGDGAAVEAVSDVNDWVRPFSVYTLGDQSALVLSLKPQIEDGSDMGAREEHVVGYLDLRKRLPLRRRLVPRFRLHGAPWTPPADDAMDG